MSNIDQPTCQTGPESKLTYIRLFPERHEHKKTILIDLEPLTTRMNIDHINKRSDCQIQITS